MTETIMRVPALAVVGSDHKIIRSTEAFRRKCEDPVALYKRAPELDLVLRGKTDTALVDLGDYSVAIEAVTDAAGKRQAMLSLPEEDLGGESDSPLAALRDAAQDSPALVWVKDLDGRYQYVNPRFERDLDTSEERLCGKTDAELPPVETVDGPRLRYIEDGLEEPLQLEYNVPAFESRPPMAAFRFALRNTSGQPIGTCGVAAPSGESHLARDEAVRLMQLERWNRLDPLDVRAELLEQWHVQAMPGPIAEIAAGPESEPVDAPADSGAPVDEPPVASAVTEAPPAAEPVALTEAPAAAEPLAPEAPEAPEPVESPEPAEAPAALAEPSPRDTDGSYHREDEWVRQLRSAAAMSAEELASTTADALQSDLQLARKWAERADQLQGDLQQATARIREAETEAQQAQSRILEAEAEAQQATAAAQLAAEEASRYKAELEQLRAELEREKAEAHAARSEVEAARRELGAARAQAESLRGPADAALRLSEELGRALAAEQERGDELARTLARIRSGLGDLDGALERNGSAKSREV